MFSETVVRSQIVLLASLAAIPHDTLPFSGLGVGVVLMRGKRRQKLAICRERTKRANEAGRETLRADKHREEENAQIEAAKEELYRRTARYKQSIEESPDVKEALAAAVKNALKNNAEKWRKTFAALDEKYLPALGDLSKKIKCLKKKK